MTAPRKTAAGLRTCPAVAREQVLAPVDGMAAWRLLGVLGTPREKPSLIELGIGGGWVAFVAAKEFETEDQAMPVVLRCEALQPVTDLR